MNDLTPTDSGTALALPTGTSLESLLKSDDGAKKLLDKVAVEARAEAKLHDATTKKGRDALISIANNASKSRAEAKRQAMSLTEKWRKDTAAVNAGRKILEDGLAELRDEIRKPVTDWEAAEEARIDRHKQALGDFDMGRVDTASPSEQIRGAIAEVEAMTTGSEWDEFQPIAEAKREQALAHFKSLLAAAEQRERDAAELARLRAEAEDRARRDAAEAERQAEAERAAEQKRLAAEAERRANEERQAAEAREAERQAQIERDKVEAAERAAKEAEARAAREAKEREEQHKRDLAEAKAREEAAAQRERDRIAAAQKAEQEAADKRRADAEHANRVKTSIRDALVPMTAPYGDEDLSLAADIAVALFDGKIPHIEVKA